MEQKPSSFNLSKPSDLLQYLSQFGVTPQKRLSQNFLIDGNILRKIVALADLSPKELVLEIGPGPGALTDALLASGANVVAVEKDPILANALRDRIREGLTLHCQDILKVDLDEIITSPAKVIANLPYHLTTPILTYLLPRHDLFSTLIVMMQLEVAERITASPGTKDYGSLTLLAQLYSQPHFGFRVSRRCFYPQPTVDSAIVRFDLVRPPVEVAEEAFFALTRRAFSQRRKMLKTSASALYPIQDIEQGLKKLGISEKARPEELSAEQFLNLYRHLKANLS